MFVGTIVIWPLVFAESYFELKNYKWVLVGCLYLMQQRNQPLFRSAFAFANAELRCSGTRLSLVWWTLLHDLQPSWSKRSGGLRSQRKVMRMSMAQIRIQIQLKAATVVGIPALKIYRRKRFWLRNKRWTRWRSRQSMISCCWSSVCYSRV